MLRLLSDENFNGDVVSGLLRRRPEIDLVRVQDVGLSGASDPEILQWAAQERRIVLTHDLTTMSSYMYERVAANLATPGVFVFKEQKVVRPTIDLIEMLNDCSSPDEWQDRAVMLPW